MYGLSQMLAGMRKYAYENKIDHSIEFHSKFWSILMNFFTIICIRYFQKVEYFKDSKEISTPSSL